MKKLLEDSTRAAICEDYGMGYAYDTISEERGVPYKTVMIRVYRMGWVEWLRKGIIDENLKDSVRDSSDDSNLSIREID